MNYKNFGNDETRHMEKNASLISKRAVYLRISERKICNLSFALQFVTRMENCNTFLVIPNENSTNITSKFLTLSLPSGLRDFS